MLSQEEVLVLEIQKQFKLDLSIQKAFTAVPRKLFVPKGLDRLAFKLDALPLNANQWISSPLTVAKMTHYLNLAAADSVLEIGCGSGYQAAILSKLVRRVFSIERIASLLEKARINFKTANLHNINTKLDDGNKGWSHFAPFDRILFSACLDKPPENLLFDQLANDGILLTPILKQGKQVLTRFTKTNGNIDSQELESCEFVAVLKGIDKT